MSSSLWVMALLWSSVPAGLLESEAPAAREHHPRVILARRDTPTATLRIVFPTGSYDDGTNPGLTRMAQHVMIEAGRIPYEKLVTELAAANASLTLDTEVRRCGFTLTAPAADF